MTTLRVVSRRHEAVSARVFEINEPHAPSGLHVRYVDGTGMFRRPRHGEISRLAKAFLAKFYRDLDPEFRHETLDLYEIQAVIAARLGSWLSGLLGLEEDYYIPPYTVVQMLRKLEVDGCFFEVRGDTVRLMAKEEGEPKATVSIRLRDSRR